MKRKNKNIAAVIIAVSLILFWVIGFIGDKKNDKLLDNKFAVTYGYIDDLGFNGGGSVVTPSYKYKVNEDSFDGNYSFNQYCERFSKNELRKILGKKLPVIYYPNDPTISKIILKKKDFVKYEIEYTSDYRNLLEDFFDCK